MTARSGIQPFGKDDFVRYKSASDEWTVQLVNGQVGTFGPGERTLKTDSDIQFQRVAASGHPETLEIKRIGDGTALREYSRELFFVLADAVGPLGTSYCTIGIPTNPEDLPATASVTYSDLNVRGVVWEDDARSGSAQGMRIIGGSGDIVGNSQSGDVMVNMTLEVESTGGGSRMIGPIQGTVSATVDTDRVGYMGLLNFGASPEYFISGGFFGPQGTETSFVFDAAIDQDGNGVNELYITGRVSAKR